MAPITRNASKQLTGQQDNRRGDSGKLTYAVTAAMANIVLGNASSQPVTRSMRMRSAQAQNSSPDSSVSLIPSPLDQLRLRLGDSAGLMDDRYYISALLWTDGNVEEAAVLIEQEQDFDLIDESLMEGLDDSDLDDMDAIVAGLEAPPEDVALASNPGPWNPRPARGPRLTTRERRAIICFEDMVYPHITDEAIIIDYLEENQWDIAAAHAQYERDRDEVMRRSQGQAATQQDSEIMGYMMDSGVPFNNNVEQERRDAARVLRDALHRTASSGSDTLLSISEAVLLLLEGSFNLTSVFDEFTDRPSAQVQLSDHYDHMRTPTSDRADQDERLSILATITQRVDLFALEKLLASHQWDLIKAIVAWYKEGVAPLRHAKDKETNKITRGWNRRCDMDGAPRDMPTNQQTRVAPRVEKGWALEAREYTAGGKQNKPPKPAPRPNSHLGSVIDEDIRTVTRGPPRPSKMHFEAIWNGKYWHGTFRHTNYRWMDQNDPDYATLDNATKSALMRKPVFDWNNQTHLEDLNKWRRQRHQRATSDKIRNPSQPFSQAERDYLYQLSREHVEELMRSTGRSWDRCIIMDIPETVKQEWADKFNAKFVGTMPAPHKRPIQQRNTNSLMTQRSRVESIRKDFKIGQIAAARKEAEGDEDNESGSDAAAAEEEEDESAGHEADDDTDEDVDMPDAEDE